MPLSKKVTILALTGFAAGCGQGNSDNVMSPQSNALTPAEVNEALGPETPVVADNVDGAIILGPNTAVTIQGITAVGTGIVSMVWEEVPY